MNHDFLIGSSQLNHAFESQEDQGTGGTARRLTRRTFIKRTGGASVATLLALNLATSKTNAQGGANDTGNTLPSKCKWYLYCAQDPSTDDMIFKGINEKPDGMYQETHRQYTGKNAHDGGYPNRVFYYREDSPFDNSSGALMIQIRSEGPVQCQRDQTGVKPSSADLTSSIKIKNNKIYCGVSFNQSAIEKFQAFADALSTGTTPNLLGYHDHDLQSGTLEIDQDSGKVSYSSNQVTVSQDGGSFAKNSIDRMTKSHGITRPHVIIQAVAAEGVQNQVKWTFGAEVPVRKANVVAGVEWQGQNVSVSIDMPWVVNKAYREVYADGSEGPIVSLGQAVPENVIEYLTPQSINNW